MGWGAIRWPGGVSGNFYLEAPGNTYLDTNGGNPLPIIWDDTTEVATPDASFVHYDPGISLTFIQVLQEVTFTGGYAFVDWPGTMDPGSVTVDLIFFEDEFTEITRITTVGGGLGNVTATVTSPITVPAGGLVRLVMTETSDYTTLSIYGEMSLDWTA